MFELTKVHNFLTCVSTWKRHALGVSSPLSCMFCLFSLNNHLNYEELYTVFICIHIYGVGYGVVVINYVRNFSGIPMYDPDIQLPLMLNCNLFADP